MTSAINLSSIPSPIKIEQKDQKDNRPFVSKQLLMGGLSGDIAKALKLSNFWSQNLFGRVTNTSHKMTEAGGTIKNYMGLVEIPDKICTIGEKWEGLKKGTTESIVRFADSVFATGKSLDDTVQLIGGRFGLLSKENAQSLNNLSSVGALSFGVTQTVYENIPTLQKNWGERPNHVASAMIKLAKHVSIAIVGALSLTAAFFIAIPKVGVIISSLITVHVVSSITSRFFDELALKPKGSIV